MVGLMPAFGVIGLVAGLIIGLAITFGFSNYKSNNLFVDIVFNDGNKVTFECSPRWINKIIDFKESGK